MKPTYRQRPAGLEAAAHTPSAAAETARPIPARPDAQRFAPHDLQALQEALDVAPFTLGKLAALVRQCPKTLGAIVRGSVTLRG